MSDKKEPEPAAHPIPVDTGEPSLLEKANAPSNDEGVPAEVADIRSTFCNGFYVTVTSGLVRIAFSESIETHTPRYRSSVVMPVDDASDLARVIQELIGDFQSLNLPPESEQTGEYDEESGEYK